MPGAVRDLKIEETDPDPDRIPVTDAHKQDIADPLTALLIPAPFRRSCCGRRLRAQTLDLRRSQAFRSRLVLSPSRQGDARERLYRACACVRRQIHADRRTPRLKPAADVPDRGTRYRHLVRAGCAARACWRQYGFRLRAGSAPCCCAPIDSRFQRAWHPDECKLACSETERHSIFADTV